MAKIEGIINHLFTWEAGLDKRYRALPLEDQFNEARKKGLANDPDDSGGLTNVGITWATYFTYCQMKRIPARTRDLVGLKYATWIDILKTLFWNACRADDIVNQSIANIFVDWFWGSGPSVLRIVQRIVKVEDDGKIGPETIGAINGYKDQKALFDQIASARRSFYLNLVKRRPKDKKFISGWLRRLNDLHYES